MRILTKNQSVELDKISIENYSVGQSILMSSAADSIVSGVEKYSLLVNNKPRILILCGKGNNGVMQFVQQSFSLKRSMMYMYIL